MHIPADLPSLAVVCVLTAGGPYRVDQAISLAFTTPSVGRLVSHDGFFPAEHWAFADAIVPETITVRVAQPAEPFELGEVLALSFIDPGIARIHSSGKRIDAPCARAGSRQIKNDAPDAARRHVQTPIDSRRDERLATSDATNSFDNAKNRGEDLLARTAIGGFSRLEYDTGKAQPSDSASGERSDARGTGDERDGAQHPLGARPFERNAPLERLEQRELEPGTVSHKRPQSHDSGRDFSDRTGDLAAAAHISELHPFGVPAIESARNGTSQQQATPPVHPSISREDRERDTSESVLGWRASDESCARAEAASNHEAESNAVGWRASDERGAQAQTASRDEIESSALGFGSSQTFRSETAPSTTETVIHDLQRSETRYDVAPDRLSETAVAAQGEAPAPRSGLQEIEVRDAGTGSAAPIGVHVRLQWTRDRVKRFIGVVDKLFTVSRLGWYRHALAMRLLVPDEVTSGDAVADVEATRHLHALREAAVETLGRPLLAAFMPSFSVSTQWLATIDSVAAARALAGLRDALTPYVEDDVALPALETAWTIGAVQRHELLSASATSVEALLPVLIPTASPNVILSERLSEYRRLLIDAFSQTARSNDAVRVNAMAQPHHALDDRLWQLVGAVGEAFDGLAVV